MPDILNDPVLGHLVLLHLGLTMLAHRRTIAQFLDDCSDGNVERLERERRRKAAQAARARAWLHMIKMEEAN